MPRKKLLSPIIVTTLLTFAMIFLLVQFWDTPLQDLLSELTVLAIYGLLVVSYLLRIALFFIGLFAVYRVLREYVNNQVNKQMEVKIGLK